MCNVDKIFEDFLLEYKEAPKDQKEEKLTALDSAAITFRQKIHSRLIQRRTMLFVCESRPRSSCSSY
jgi:hypothetical protein